METNLNYIFIILIDITYKYIKQNLKYLKNNQREKISLKKSREIVDWHQFSQTLKLVCTNELYLWIIRCIITATVLSHWFSIHRHEIHTCVWTYTSIVLAYLSIGLAHQARHTFIVKIPIFTSGYKHPTTNIPRCY